MPADILERRLGRHGPELLARARGVDASPVGDEREAKSVGHEHTFDVDTASAEVIERTLLALAEGVAGRLRAGHLRARTVAVKVRASDFTTLTRQRTLPDATDETDLIWRTALDLARPQVRGIHVRLLGISASQLVAGEQMALLESGATRRQRALEAADRVRERFGPRAITRARLLGSNVAQPFERDTDTAPEARRVGRPRQGS